MSAFRATALLGFTMSISFEDIKHGVNYQFTTTFAAEAQSELLVSLVPSRSLVFMRDNSLNKRQIFPREHLLCAERRERSEVLGRGVSLEIFGATEAEAAGIGTRRWNLI